MAQVKAASTARQEYYSINDIAEIMNVSRETARKMMIAWADRGMTVIAGSRLRIRRDIFDGEMMEQDGFNKAVGYRDLKLLRGRRRA
jgi:transposase